MRTRRTRTISLTEREHQILDLASTGRNDTQIARKMHLYPQSVNRSHRKAEKKLETLESEHEWANKRGYISQLTDKKQKIKRRKDKK
jgi:DNA-binding CsgD family transcriptional regulator